MCLAIPGKIESITQDTPDSLSRKGKVNFGGILKEISLAYVPEAQVGEYVIVHVGFALGIVQEEEAKKVFEYLKTMGELEELSSPVANPGSPTKAFGDDKVLDQLI
ncbi:MAG: HypC/HybG/HupF family hydrogenase formation chaperone [Candidatus Omnitrophica bacterium]|nr:HypC/HybG/HupF family hydrogenase formation chaperone [Candidatus Omnitrophota bacterium]